MEVNMLVKKEDELDKKVLTEDELEDVNGG